MGSFLKIKGTQIGSGVITNDHVAAGAAIAETKLALDYGTSSLHTGITDITGKKHALAVQATIAASGTGTTKVVTTEVTDASFYKTFSGDASTNGVVCAPPYNKVQIRKTSDGQPIEHTPGGADVFGRLTEGDGTVTLSYRYMNAGVETAHTMAADQSIDILFVESYATLDIPFASSLNSVAFVDGLPASHNHVVADLTDLTVSAIDLNNVATLSGLAALTGATLIGFDGTASGLTAATVKLALDEIVSDMGTMDTTIRTDFAQGDSDTLQSALDADGAHTTLMASTSTGEGSDLVGFFNGGTQITATTVRGALAELDGDIQNIISTGGSSGIPVIGEIIDDAGAIKDGIVTSFTTVDAYKAESLRVIVNGSVQARGKSFNEVSPAAGTFAFVVGAAPEVDDVVVVDYLK